MTEPDTDTRIDEVDDNPDQILRTETNSMHVQVQLDRLNQMCFFLLHIFYSLILFWII